LSKKKKPNPIPKALREELLENLPKNLVDSLAEYIHDSWWTTKASQGFHHPSEKHKEWNPNLGKKKYCEKCHLDMIPYKELPESSTIFDKVTIEAHEKEIKQVQKQFGMKDKREPKIREPPEGAPNQPEQDNEPEIHSRFFMSHSTKDFTLVKKMSDIIETWPGCKAWYCERDIFHGQDWMEAIYDGIEMCNWYILFWSPNAEASKWTIEEIREAKLRNIESENTNPKVSIVNMGMPGMPRLLTRSQGSKVVDDVGFDEFMKRLKDQIAF